MERSNLRTGVGLDPHFRTLWERQEDSSFIEHRLIKDVRSVLLQYCKIYWGIAPTGSKNRGPGRPRGRCRIDGQAVRRYREELGVTQAALAERANLSVDTISDVENDHGTFDNGTLEELLGAINAFRQLKDLKEIVAGDLLKKRP